jgi:hypothetical protein
VSGVDRGAAGFAPLSMRRFHRGLQVHRTVTQDAQISSHWGRGDLMSDIALAGSIEPAPPKSSDLDRG